MGLIVQGQQVNPQYLYGFLGFDSVTSDPLAGTVNNLAINGDFFASQYNLQASEDVTLTGIANGRPSKIITLVNRSAFTLSLAANDSGSDAANQFGASATLAAGTTLQLIYDGELSLWMPAAGSSSGGAGPVVLSSVLTPDALAAGNNNNYTTDGIQNASVIRFTPNAGGSTLTGIVAPAVGQQLVIYNIAAGDLTLAHDATSTAANRFLCPGSVDHILIENDSATIWYDLTSARWRVQ